MGPKLQAVKAALENLDRTPEFSFGYAQAHKALQIAVTAAGFTQRRCVEDWARYQVAVGEAAEQVIEADEPEPASGELFG